MPDGEFNPDSKASALNAQGAAHHQEGRVDAARAYYDAALLLEPDHPLALQNLTGVLFASEQNEAALSVANRAIAAAPNNPHARANRAAALMHLGRYEKAKKELEGVLRLLPDADGLWHNYSLVRYMMGDVRAAVGAVQKSIALGATCIQERESDLGIFLLASGDLQAGLAQYECRWNALYKSRAWELGVPEWKGEDLHGRRLLVHHEQGFGDGIMLARFIPALCERGADVTVAVPKELIRLFEANYATKCVEWKAEYAGDFDYHTPMLSAMRWLGTTKESISPRPYLNAPALELKGIPRGRLNVGICWESGDHSPALRKRRRTVPLDLFFPLAELPGVRLISLQKGEGQKDIINLGAESFVFDLMGRVEDFYDTARLIASLDLVISVDSAVVHLAGALGKPAIMLGPHTRCWRWWRANDGLPWYENMRIFAQETPHGWIAPMRRTVAAVQAKLAA